MQLDKRSSKLFDELMSNPGINSKELEEKYDLTRRQLGYSFNKINDWLLMKNLPEIERTRQGHFIIDQSLITKMSDEQEIDLSDMNILSESQRVYMIMLMLLSSEEELSLNHFTSELDVSKNTILNDLKQVREIASDYGVAIRYSRIKGYIIDGKEFQIRKLLINVIDKILEMSNGEDRIRQLADIEMQDLKELSNRIEKVENKLNLKFTDEKILTMPYTLSLVLRRIKLGKEMKTFYIQYEELSGTKEYQATEEILFDFEDIPMQERLFITLHLLTTNVHWAEMLTEETIPNLVQALDNMLHLFEKSACISLQDREQLLDKLLLHVTPAYYRIKYHLTEVGDIENLVSKDYKELHHLVSQSTKPLADLIGSDIPDSETTYLTMLIGGWLRRQGDSIEEKVKAIVVCPKGVSVSRLMLSELRELFPEFVFLDTLSVREFHHYKLEYDIVFSPIFVETDKKLFLASSFLEREEKYRLRRQVMMELNGYIPREFNVDDILEIVKKYAVVQNEHQLSRELHGYINPDDTRAFKQQTERPTANLSELITPNKITLKKSVASWEEAIRTSAAPIVESGHIEPEYVNAVIDHCEEDPYIVIGKNIAIPHAAPDEGVNDVSMSLLRLEEGVQFTDHHSIHLVVIIAAVDKLQHLKALLQLMKLAQSEKDRDAIIRAETKEDIYTILKDYSTE